MIRWDADCQDCKRRRWAVGLSTIFGYIYCCTHCAEFLLRLRENNPKQFDTRAKKAKAA